MYNFLEVSQNNNEIKIIQKIIVLLKHKSFSHYHSKLLD